MGKLGTVYLKEGLLKELATWRQFIDGFNNAFPYSYFIDAGDEEDQVRGKIQGGLFQSLWSKADKRPAQIKLFFNQPNCKHTVLISSAEDIFTGFIRQYTANDDVCGQITFIEAIPFPGAFEELANHFIPAEKEGLFGNNESNRPLLPLRPLIKPTPICLQGSSESRNEKLDPSARPLTPTSARLQYCTKHTNQSTSSTTLPPTPTDLQDSTRPRNKKLDSSSAPVTPTPATRSRIPVTFLSGHGQVIRRKPLAQIENQLPSPRNACFNSKGQRIDCMVYQSTCSERYLQC